MNKEEREKIARVYFNQGYNCCQSVVMAFKDLSGVDEKSLLKLSVGLGGGVGRMREVCGCVCGMAVLSGLIAPEGANPHEQKMNAYTLTQKMSAEFKKETGSIVCRELLGGQQNSDGHHLQEPSSDATTNSGQERSISPVPEKRTEEYYRKRPCIEMVALAARIVSESLGEE